MPDPHLLDPSSSSCPRSSKPQPPASAPPCPSKKAQTLPKDRRHVGILSTLLHAEIPIANTSNPPRYTRRPSQLNDPVDPEGTFLADMISGLSLERCKDGNFYGRSSGVSLLMMVKELKKEYLRLSGDDSWDTAEFFDASRAEDIRTETSSAANTVPSFEAPRFIFPETDLMRTLVDLYFERLNSFFPVLHRPTFERELAQGLHHSEEFFAAVLLLVCATASRFSDDQRVLLDVEAATHRSEGHREGNSTEHHKEDSWHSAGWKWFAQVPAVMKVPLSPPSLYQLQYCVLLSLFLQGTSAPHASWHTVGVGIRFAQDVGAHRKRLGPLTAEDELWKRAFWALVCMDRIFSAYLGRPCAISDEDFDVELPVECDDEYWDHQDPQKRWMQPQNVPSVIAYFNRLIKLCRILAALLKTIYATNKLKEFTGPEWEESIVTELDSSLKKWVDSTPDHLRWDPHRQNTIHLNQSASLYSTYYLIQILVHRPFMAKPRKPGSTTLPSLAICMNAARACSHVVGVQRTRGNGFAPLGIQWAAFSAGTVLLMNVWGGRRTGSPADSSRELADIQKCIDILKATESRWYAVGRLTDIMYELLSAGDLPQGLPLKNKRGRGDQTENPYLSRDPSPLGAGSSTLSGFQATRPVQQQQYVSSQRAAANYWYGSPDSTQIPHQPQLIIPEDHLPPSFRRTLLTGGEPQYSLSHHEAMQMVPSYPASGANDVYRQHLPLGSSRPRSREGLITSTTFGSSIHTESRHSYQLDYQNSNSDAATLQNPQQTFGAAYGTWPDAPGGYEMDKWRNYLSDLDIAEGKQE